MLERVPLLDKELADYGPTIGAEAVEPGIGHLLVDAHRAVALHVAVSAHGGGPGTGAAAAVAGLAR